MSASPYGYLSYTKDNKTTLQYQQIREGKTVINGEKITGLIGDYQEQIKELMEQMVLLEYKEAFYQNIMKNNLKDSWNPINNIQIEERIAI